MIDDTTLGFADLSGNRQYITVGNLQTESRVAFFLMDYVARRRLKIFGHATVLEGTSEAAEWIPDYDRENAALSLSAPS